VVVVAVIYHYFEQQLVGNMEEAFDFGHKIDY